MIAASKDVKEIIRKKRSLFKMRLIALEKKIGISQLKKINLRMRRKTGKRRGETLRKI